MTITTLDRPAPPGPRSGLAAGRGRGFGLVQRIVLGLAAIPPLVIAGALGGWALGLVDREAAVQTALAAGENPGTITFGAMFLASPVQWLTGRTQVRVRKWLGIIFYLLALSNGAMFAVESGVGQAVAAPFLVAGTVGLVAATPLFLTSGRWAQRAMGMARWRALHRLTYLVAAALAAHVLLIGDVGLGFVLIMIGAIARLAPVRRRLEARGRPRRSL